MKKTNFNSFPNTITRAVNYGKTNLLYHVDSKKSLTDPDIPNKDYTNTVEDFGGFAKKPNMNKITRLNSGVVANQTFIAEHPVIYQGYKKGPVLNRLPESWNPVEEKKYDPNIGGSTFNNGSGETQTQNNFRELKTPDLNLQWKDSIANNPSQPNPFPIYITKNQKIKA
jgi:hypothetical protein